MPICDNDVDNLDTRAPDLATSQFLFLKSGVFSFILQFIIIAFNMMAENLNQYMGYELFYLS